MKKCGKCKKEKDFSEFYKNKSTKSGFTSSCKICHSKSNKKTHYYTTYGITIEEYNTMLKNQDNKCKICNSLKGARNLHIDHCHETGKVRGLLCANCNTGIGNLKDNIELLEKAINYLKDNLPN